MSSITLGGDRLGSGKDMKVGLRSYERSTHDLGYVWKSTMSVGTLVPFMSELALPGDSFEIDLMADVRTIPTNGPLFGSFKVQLDVFKAPARLYMKQLHNNKLNVGMNMSSITLPQYTLNAWNPPYDYDGDLDNYQINSSSIFKYLNVSGLGLNDGTSVLRRSFNALPWLSYWDIYKNYYANKQEEIGAVIHTPNFEEFQQFEDVEDAVNGQYNETATSTKYTYDAQNIVGAPTTILIYVEGGATNFDLSNIQLNYTNSSGVLYSAFVNDPIINWSYATGVLVITVPYNWIVEDGEETIPNAIQVVHYEGETYNDQPRVQIFPLSEIDDMRENCLTQNNVTIDSEIGIQPWSLALMKSGFNQTFESAAQFNQEGLGLKTYQSDLFNNWLSTEYIDGENGINEITKVQVQDDGFYLDDLNIMKKIYLMLNRVAVSDGTYKSWLETVYSHKISNWVVETPMYIGGLIKEMTFDEVISTAATTSETTSQPLGTLAGKGVMTNKNKGGYIKTSIDEPSYLIGIVSLTPRIDYSQGNKWDTQLKTMDDLHKPQLDGIGFQELITDQMAWFDTKIDSGGRPIFKSAGKQPAWINYMTNVNQTRGNFAVDGEEMFMTLNRKFEFHGDGTSEWFGIGDLTTYIDPSKYNDIFSYNKLDAQNFWTQIKVDIKARRKMSAKVMPSL